MMDMDGTGNTTGDRMEQIPTQPTDLRGLVSNLQTSVAVIRTEQNNQCRLIEQAANDSRRILEILQGTLETRGVIQRLTELEAGQKSLEQGLKQHIQEHQQDQREEEEGRKEEETFQRRRGIDLKDKMNMAIIAMILSVLGDLVLRLFGK